MKFLHHFYDLQQRAGIQRAICELCNALIQQEQNATIVSTTSRNDIAYQLDPNVDVISFRNPEPFGSGLQVWPAKLRWAALQYQILKRAVEENEPDVVVDHGTALGLLYPGATFCGRPFVLQRHFPVRSFPGGWGLYRAISLVASRKKKIVALTESIAQDLKDRGARDVTVIANPIPADIIPAPYPSDGPRVGLLMGRACNPQKGFDLFLHALGRKPIPDWRFQIVGPGVNEDPLLKSLVGEYALGAYVELLPPTKDPYALMRSASCVIMPSRYEALPMVALEALRLGRPVIASDADGLRDLVAPGVNGVLFPACNVAALRNTLDTVCANPQLLRRLAASAPASVERFSAPAIARQWLSLATDLIPVRA